MAINNSMAEREKSFLEKLKDSLNRSQGNVKTRNARDWFQRKARALKSELRSKFTQVDTADEFYQNLKRQASVTLDLVQCLRTFMIQNIKEN